MCVLSAEAEAEAEALPPAARKRLRCGSCPIDRVSHSACLRAKKFCKRAAKTFVPLRSASLSSLAAGLHRAVDDEGPAGGPSIRPPAAGYSG